MEESRYQLFKHAYDDVVYVQSRLRSTERKGLADVLNGVKKLLKELVEEQRKIDRD